MTQARNLSVQLTAPSPGMTLQNVHVQPGAAGIAICATWRHAPACNIPSATDAADTSPQMRGHLWLSEKIKEWKAAC